jgi:chromate transporter
MLRGVTPVIVAIVVQALRGLVPKAWKSRPLAALGVLACVAAALHVEPLIVLLASGVVAVVLARRPPVLPAIVPLLGVTSFAVPASAVGLLLVFAKIGATVFGSGYVLLAFLRADLVDRLHWLTERQLLDAVAVGQVTPGPVFTTATFIGYLVAGVPGAVTATLGIFLPGFLLVAASGRLIARLRGSPAASAFLDGVNAGSVGLMALVTVEIGRTAIVDLPTGLLALVSAALLLRFDLGPGLLIAAGAAVGLALGAGR